MRPALTEFAGWATNQPSVLDGAELTLMGTDCRLVTSAEPPGRVVPEAREVPFGTWQAASAVS